MCYLVGMRPVEALYENGLLRPAKPLNLRPGERVGLIVVRQADPSRWDLARLAAASAVSLAAVAGAALAASSGRIAGNMS